MDVAHGRKAMREGPSNSWMGPIRVAGRVRATTSISTRVRIGGIGRFFGELAILIKIGCLSWEIR